MGTVEEDRDEPELKQREIRVFVSSTFRDMQAERNYLRKETFPKLRKKCEQRGVAWREVDLRVGVPVELKAEGKVLPYCLEEIKRCKPYFIGLLGERYGWVPEPGDIPRELHEKEEWLKEHPLASITELEIQHGVLRNPEMAEHAFFYFRKEDATKELAEEEPEDFLEIPGKDEIKKYGQEEAEKRAETRKAQLERLKEVDIKGSGFPIRRDYTDPKSLGALIEIDLEKVIDQGFPEESMPDPLDREANEHEAFAASRRRVYIRRGAYFEPLNAHAKGDGDPMVVLGESGAGKSALLANWVKTYRQSNPGVPVIMHFIGSSPYSADWQAMLRRIMGELKRRFKIEQEIPDKPDALRSAFANWLHMAAERGRVIIILDALNQLEDRDQALDLIWLPPVIPSNVRLILSTLPGRPLDELEKRQYPKLKVTLLDKTERRELIKEYLKTKYGQELSGDHIKTIAEAEQTANPLYLGALLEELRITRNPGEQKKAIEHYLTAATIPDLYAKILQRYEKDFQDDRPGLVRDAMTAIWSARRGLSEAELLDLLGTEAEPLAGAYWSPMFLAAESAFVLRSGLLAFAHDYMRDAVQRRYLPGEEEQKDARLDLARFFSQRDPGSRQIDELPWLLAEAGSWKALYDLLASLDVLSMAWKADEFELKGYWTKIEMNSPLKMVNAYRPVLDDPKQYSEIIWNLAILFQGTGHPREAAIIWQCLIENLKQKDDRSQLLRVLGNQGANHYAQSCLEEAMVLFKKQERICRELRDKEELSRSLGNQGTIHYVQGRLDEAMALYKEQEDICRELEGKKGLSTCLGNQGTVHYARSCLDEAMALHKEGEDICRELGDKEGLSRSLGYQGTVHDAQNRPEEAMALYKEGEDICRELGHKEGLSRSLGDQGVIHSAQGRLEEAMKLYKEQERICIELGDKEGLARSLANQAELLAFGLSNAQEALPLAEEASRLATDHGYAFLAEEIEPILRKIEDHLAKKKGSNLPLRAPIKTGNK